jgi:subtilisin family serine protease
MNKITTLFIALSIAGLLHARPEKQNPLTDQVIIKYKNEMPAAKAAIDLITREFKGETLRRIPLGKKSDQAIYVLRFPAAVDISKAIEAYNHSGMIEYAEPDALGSAAGVQAIIPNDQHYSRQYSLKNNGTFSLSPAITGADIEMENAWSIETGDTNVVVATIDSGCKLDHPEFSGRIWKNYAEIPNNSTDDDANGKVDDIQGWDFANNDNNPSDDHGHGTNVTGIIGANGNNSIGYAGVDWKCKHMILKGLDNNSSGYYSWWADAIYYAVDNGARVINMSLAGTSSSTTLQNAVNYATSNNVVVLAAIGNANSNVINYPAGLTGVIAVGSTDANDKRSNPFFWSSTSGSSYGPHISVVAPGNYIYGLDYQSNTNYNSYWGGTSQACPHAAGVAALLLAQDPTRTPGQVRSILETTAEDQVGNPAEDIAGFDNYYGHGRLNAFLALSVLSGVNANSIQFSYELFPNPSSGDLTIVLPSASDGQTFMQITNAVGQQIRKAELTSRITKLNVQGLKGVHFITISKSTGTCSKKVVFME